MFWCFVSFNSRGTATLVTAIITAVIAVATLTPLPTAIDAPGSDKLHRFSFCRALISGVGTYTAVFMADCFSVRSIRWRH